MGECLPPAIHLEDQTAPQRTKPSQLLWPFLKHPEDVCTMKHHHEEEESLSHPAFQLLVQHNHLPDFLLNL